MCNSRYCSISLILAAATLLMGNASRSNADEPVKPDPVKYRLVNVTIPADSPLRNDEDVHKPPRIFLGVRKNGNYIGGWSTAVPGWSVDLPQEAGTNEWDIDEDPKATYTIEVWDSHFWHNHLIFSVTQMPSTAFREKILEMTGALITEERKATIKFVPVK